MEKQTNQEINQEISQKIRTQQTLSVQPEKGTCIKITGTDTAFIDDIAATISNTYHVLKASAIFKGTAKHDLDDPVFFTYLTILPAQRSRRQ